MTTGASPDVGDPESPFPLAADRREALWRDIPSHTDAVAADFSSALGGPVGRHAVIGRQRYLTPVRVVLFVALLFLALAWFGKAACVQQTTAGGALALDRSGNRQYTALCYSEIIPLFDGAYLRGGAMPYKTSWVDADAGVVRSLDEPAGVGLFLFAAANVASFWSDHGRDVGLPTPLEVILFFDAAAFGLALMWLLAVWATTRSAGRRVWTGLLVAASPLVVVHAYTGFAVLAVALTAVALLAWARRLPWVAGAALGLAATTAFYPALLLVPLFALCLRAGRLRQWATVVVAGAVAWWAVNLPLALAYRHGWQAYFDGLLDRAAGLDSVYGVVTALTGYDWGRPDGASVLVNGLVFGGVLLVCAGVVVLALAAPVRPRLAQLAFLTVAGLLLVGKDWLPEQSLWLLPLAVLAIPHTRVLLAWMVVDALVWVPKMMWQMHISPVGGRHGLDVQWFGVAVALRDIVVIGLCALVVAQILRPADDLVRRPSGQGAFLGQGPDDPLGGVLTRTPDRVTLRRGQQLQSQSQSQSPQQQSSPQQSQQSQQPPSQPQPSHPVHDAGW